MLDMGEPVRIVELAREMVRLSGFCPGADMDIHYTGLRPGERLFEELFSSREATDDNPRLAFEPSPARAPGRRGGLGAIA